MNSVLAERALPGNRILQVVQGDITLEAVDAIVNAANEQLQHGGGVARAISQKGGPAIQQESDAWIRRYGPVSHPSPAWTSGGLLPSKFVIHAVGPVWGQGDEDQKLAEAVKGSLGIADELKCGSLSMPAISTGIFGFPKERAARIILDAIEGYFKEGNSGLSRIRIILFDLPTIETFMDVWSK